MNISVIADDLTGANDCAAQFALYADTKVFLSSNDSKIKDVSVAVFDTESRDIAKEDAFNIVFQTSALIKQERITKDNSQHSIFYKKIDSTVRGNIGSELEATIRAIKPQITVIAPAFPQSGRTTLNGKQLLNGIALENTELRNIPKSPITSSFIPDIINKQSSLKTAVITLDDIQKGSEHIFNLALTLKEAGNEVIVCDVQDNSDLDAIAKAFLQFEQTIFVGSAGLANSIAALVFPKENQGGNFSVAQDIAINKVLVLAGSISTITRNQCLNLLDNLKTKDNSIKTLLIRIDPEKFLTDSTFELNRITSLVKDTLQDLKTDQKICTLIAAALDESDVEKSKAAGIAHNISFFNVGERMALMMGQLMSALCPLFDAFIMTGGDTAVHACNAVNSTSFKVLGELEKGIPVCRMDGGLPQGKILITKAGALGSPAVFTKAVFSLCNLNIGNSDMKKPILGITMGDASGIGSEITVKALLDPKLYDKAIPVVFGDAYQLERAAKIIGSSIKVHRIDDPSEANPSVNQIEVIDLGIIPHDIEFGKVNAACGKGAYEFIAKAVSFAKQHKIHAIVTAPLNKEALHLGGCPHPGHTEILAALTDTKDYSMMLVGDKLRVIHVSTHVSLRKACDLVKQDRVKKVIHLANDTLKLMGFADPRIAVSGLNPHCGEGGLFGTEDMEEIVPAVAATKAEGINVTGPIAPDTVFHRAANKGEFDIVVVMYHDQGHIPLKVLGFSSGVNVTVGLPCIRTSVDHGTAFEIAGKGIADPESMTVALNLGAQMAQVKFKDLLNS